MGDSLRKLVLLPGLDGTGTLFSEFVAAMGSQYEAAVVSYSTSAFMDYSALASIVESAVPPSEPFVIVAESFSTPLAIRYAATEPPNLKALVTCAGFASNPLRGWQRVVTPLLLPVMFGIPAPPAALRFFLIGRNAPASLLTAVQHAISRVPPRILRDRLRAILACDMTADLKRITMPMLYVQAENDKLVGVEAVKEIKNVKPDVTVAKVGGPHLVLQRQAQEAATVIRQFITSLENSE